MKEGKSRKSQSGDLHNGNPAREPRCSVASPASLMTRRGRSIESSRCSGQSLILSLPPILDSRRSPLLTRKADQIERTWCDANECS